MTEIYYTPDLYKIDNKMYYKKSITNHIIKLSESNWFKYLVDYGWERLDIKWVRRLNRYKKYKYSCWGVLDCDGNGDCLFNVIAETLNEPYSITIRERASQMINNENFETIIGFYRISVDNNEFYHEWDPYEIKTVDDLKKELCKEGNNYWGDYIVLHLLEEALNINFILLWNDPYKVYNIGIEFKEERPTIILYYIDNTHFKLVGKFIGNEIVTLFNKIPEEIWQLYREDCHIK